MRTDDEAFHQLLNASTETMLLIDTEGTIVELNEVAARRLGHAQDELIGANVYDILPLDVARTRRAHVEEAIRCGKPRRFEDEREGIIFDSSICPVVDAQGSIIHIAIFGRDITQRVQMEDELRAFRDHLERRVEERTAQLETANRELAAQIADCERLQAELIQASKMNALGTMAGGIAHEVRNPLSIISSCNQLLQEHPDNQQVRGQCIEKITAACQRASLIVENLLTFAAPAEEQIEQVNLNTVLDNAMVLLGHRMDRQGITLKKDLQADLPTVMGNPPLLQQVFINLMLNATDAMGEGGRLTVSTRVTDHDEVTIEFSDTGPGISPEHLPEIFDPFFTTKPVGEGEGLGLSISYSIIQQHNGSIQVESQPGQGATFSVRLPAAEQ